jgi:glycosyltransferase involved in cell wall biosynthesis
VPPLRCGGRFQQNVGVELIGVDEISKHETSGFDLVPSMGRPRVEITILTRNRPDYLRESLRSCLEQEPGPFSLSVRISDNSDDSCTEQIIANEFPEIRYVRRAPACTAEEHFKLVIEESYGDLIVLFHDDDVMLPHYTRKMVGAFEQYPSASAIGSNAVMIDGAGKVLRNAFHRHRQDKIIGTGRDLFEFYYPKSGGCSPFPSYMYRKSVLSTSLVDSRDAGKYSDVSLLSKLTSSGHLVILPHALIKYRWHGGNDSSDVSLVDYQKLWRYMMAHGAPRDEILMWRRVVLVSKYARSKTVRSLWAPIIPNGTRKEWTLHWLGICAALRSRPSRLLLRLLAGLVIHPFSRRC